MKLTYTDIKYKLHNNSVVEFDTCPVGGHNYNQKAERRICQIKEFFEKNFRMKGYQFYNGKLYGNIISDYENMDLMTPT